jgi:hypothetical protein
MSSPLGSSLSWSLPWLDLKWLRWVTKECGEIEDQSLKHVVLQPAFSSRRRLSWNFPSSHYLKNLQLELDHHGVLCTAELCCNECKGWCSGSNGRRIGFPFACWTSTNISGAGFPSNFLRSSALKTGTISHWSAVSGDDIRVIKCHRLSLVVGATLVYISPPVLTRPWCEPETEVGNWVK